MVTANLTQKQKQELGSYWRAFQDPREFAREFARTVYTHDVKGASIERFPADWEYIDQLWQPYMDRWNVVLEKSRQLACSWFGAVTRCWSVSTPIRHNWRSMMMSRKESLVDNPGHTTQALLGKVKFVYDHLPEAMRHGLDFAHLSIRNPNTGSSITGLSTTSESGRGDNYDDGWWDEAAFFDHSEAVYAACADGIPRGLWMVSTPSDSGKSTAMYRIRQRPGTGEKRFHIFRAHWSQHPERACTCTKPLDLDPRKHSGCWYASYCETHTERQIAQEQNIEWSVAGSGKVFSRFDSSVHVHDEVPVIPGLPIFRAWDFGIADETAITIAQVRWMDTINGNRVPQIRIIAEVVDNGKAHTYYRERLQEIAERMHHGHRVVDWGDPFSLNQRESDLSSWRLNLRNNQHPYKVYCKPTGCVGKSYDTVLDNARKFQDVVQVVDGDDVIDTPLLIVSRATCPKHIDMFESWAYRTDDQGQVTSRKPVHDQYSHPGDSFKYLAWTVWPPKPAHTKPPEDVTQLTDGQGEVFSPRADSVYEGGWIT